MTEEALNNLFVDAVTAVPFRVDWSEADGERWLTYEAVACEKCGHTLVLEGAGGDCQHDDIDPDATLPPCTVGVHHGGIGPCESCSDSTGEEGIGICDCVDVPCDGHVPEATGPMMNYFYPCPLKETYGPALAIAHLPLCVVEDTLSETVGFALTGGGMDLSWEICAAYVSAGYLPPTSIQLPQTASSSLKQGWMLDVFQAMRRSIEVQQNWLRNSLDRLDELKQWCEDRDAKRKTTKDAQQII